MNDGHIREAQEQNSRAKEFHTFERETATQAKKLQVKQAVIYAHSDKMKKRQTYVPHPRKPNLYKANNYT